MKIVGQILAFLTVTTIVYLVVRNSKGFATATTAVATSIANVQKTAQGR